MGGKNDRHTSNMQVHSHWICLKKIKRHDWNKRHKGVIGAKRINVMPLIRPS